MRKAQAAMEFLLTYGWAVLVVLAAIVSLSYFGVISPARFMPEVCQIQPTSGISCIDFSLSPATASLFLMNGGGSDIHMVNVSIGSCSYGSPIDLIDGSSVVVNLTGCGFGSSGQKVKEEIMIFYSGSGGLTKSAKGSLVAVLH